MFAAFKALSIGAKLGILAALVAILIATGVVAYNRGLNVSKVEIASYETEKQQLRAELAKIQGKTDVRIVTEYKDRVQYVDRVRTETKTIVKTVVPEQYDLSKGWIYVYDRSVAGLEPDSTFAADASPSEISDRTALLRITENNSICLANAEQLGSLQAWIRETEANREKISNSK